VFASDLDVVTTVFEGETTTLARCGSATPSVMSASLIPKRLGLSQQAYTPAKVLPGGDCDQPSAFQVGKTLVPKNCKKRRKRNVPSHSYCVDF
jgi:hypothetical protein